MNIIGWTLVLIGFAAANIVVILIGGYIIVSGDK
jgi:hypothetical protein